jgi:hypothetical protein
MHVDMIPKQPAILRILRMARHSGVSSVFDSNGTDRRPLNRKDEEVLLGMLNKRFGTSFTHANVISFYLNESAVNLIIYADNLTPCHFNALRPGRFTTYGWQWLKAYGMAGHIADEPNRNKSAVFHNDNVGGMSVHFAFHDDHGYTGNPWGAAIHFDLDVLRTTEDRNSRVEEPVSSQDSVCFI